MFTSNHPTTAPVRGHGKIARRLRDYEWFGALPFISVHIAALGAFWTGARWQDWLCCVVLYWTRMFGVTGVYHRYFAHRSYKTSRFMQFVLAFWAQTSSQKGALWWAAHHRSHHRYSDTEKDVHSPLQHGFWYSHMGWLFDQTAETDYRKTPDLARYPELVFLNRYWPIPPIVLGVTVWSLLGWSGLWVGFALSTVLVWHGTFLVNSAVHLVGKRRFRTKDDSRNNWWVAILTMGEGWHNNHHYYEASVRQGFYWWEIDLSYYVLRTMQALGLVWDLKMPPKNVVSLDNPDRYDVPAAQTPALASLETAESSLPALSTKASEALPLSAARSQPKEARQGVATSLKSKENQPLVVSQPQP